MEEKTLYKRLERYAEEGVLPMHMPGHKRACFEHLASLGAKLDITEIDSFDDLTLPRGYLQTPKAWRQSCGEAARLCFP